MCVKSEKRSFPARIPDYYKINILRKKLKARIFKEKYLRKRKKKVSKGTRTREEVSDSVVRIYLSSRPFFPVVRVPRI